MTHKPLPIGVDDFGKMIEGKFYYVDKTLFIKELLDKRGEVNHFTRPRRFGKSLTISMLKYFFDNTELHSHLFEGLKIMSTGEKYTSQMNQYPLINITLKNADQSNYSSSLMKLKEELIREFDRHRYLLKSDKIEEEKKKLYKNIIDETADNDKYSSSLRFLSECLIQHHGKKVIILIDKYDVPLERAYFNGYYNEMLDFLRSLFNTALKTNRSLNFAVMTGCLRVSIFNSNKFKLNLESIFTGFNNPKIISITSSEYGEYFGFTEEEVDNALTYYQLDEKKEEVRSWYNGYMLAALTFIIHGVLLTILMTCIMEISAIQNLIGQTQAPIASSVN